MTYKQIEAAREVRLWIGQIIVPAAVTVLTLYSITEVRNSISAKTRKTKESIKTKLQM